MEIRYPLILDGATGTQLQKRGYKGGLCAEKWILEHPEAILELQEKYVRSGSQVVYASTFGANRAKLEAQGLFGKVAEYNEKLVTLSKQAAGERAFVAGDLAPTGLFLYPFGETSFEELVEIYTEQAAALEKAGVDLFVIETTMTMAEARAAVLAVKSVSRKPLFVSFTCDENGRSLTGTDIAAALVVMQGMGVDAFGLNCSAGPDVMLRHIKRLAPLASVPLMAKPNAGMPEIIDGETVYNCPPEEFAASARELAELGVCIFGGCCGTTEEHIAALSAALEGVSPKAPGVGNAELLPCATEKQAFFLPLDAGFETVLSCDEQLEDELEDALDEEGDMIALRISSEDELETFADCQYMITKPLCIVCDDADLLEQALRLYQGRALYEGSLPDEELLPLAAKYGLII